jgi:hypothetical protein
MSEPPLISLYDGDRECIGFLLNRGHLGWEAFDANERPLGVFEDQAAAAASIAEPAPRATASRKLLTDYAVARLSDAAAKILHDSLAAGESRNSFIRRQ